MHHCRSAARRDFARSDTPRYGPPRELQPRAAEVSLRPDLGARRADFEVALTVVCHTDGARALTLDAIAFAGLTVEALDGAALDFHYTGEKLQLVWAEPFARGDERRVKIAYHLDHPLTGLSFTGPDEAYPDRPSLVVSDNETERARFWLPCIDHPSVRMTFLWRLTGPADWVLLAGGALESETDNGDGTKTAVWKLDEPCPAYLACVAMGDFVRCDDRPAGEVPISYFGPKGATAEELQVSFGRTPDIMEWMVKKLDAPFPFPKYYQFAAPGIGGAMENISLTSWDDFLVLDTTAARELGYLIDSINVHEMAHSYFGDALVIRHFSHAWLKESWATYMEACWMEDCKSVDEYRYDMLCSSRRYRAEADGRYQRPIVTEHFDSSWDMFDGHLYPGGACRLDMLRRLLGDDDFWAGVRKYVADYSGKLVETKDFQRALEDASGRNLDWFFSQWFHRAGYPRLKVKVSYDKEKGRARIKVEQTQDKPFRVDLDVALEGPDGSWTRTTLALREKIHQTEVAIGEPQQCQVDPDAKLLHRQELDCPEGWLRRTLREGEHLAQRVWAALHLCEKGGKKNFDALREAYASEPFWGVRAEIARAVAGSGGAFAPDLLADFLGREEDDKARLELATVCSLKSPVLAAALRGFLDKDLAYRTRAAALGALGAQRCDEDLERLRAATADDGYLSLVRGGGFVGLAHTRREDVFATLLGALPYGAQPEKARRAVATAVGLCAPWLEKRHQAEAVEALAQVPRDVGCDGRSIYATTVALAGLSIPAAATALEGLRPLMPPQDHAELVRKADAVRARLKPDGEVGKLKKELSTLKDDLRGALERLALLEERSAPDAAKPGAGPD